MAEPGVTLILDGRRYTLTPNYTRTWIEAVLDEAIAYGGHSTLGLANGNKLIVLWGSVSTIEIEENAGG